MHRMSVMVVCLAAVVPLWTQTVALRPAQPRNFPSAVDSNSPALWNNGELIVYNSTGLGPVRSSGPDQSHLTESHPVVLGPSTHRPYWIEATWTDTDGTIFAWYHHEPPGVCGRIPLTAPQIGALVSYDGGNSFLDMGIVLESGYPVDCSAQNGFFAGGNGDFSVVRGRNQRYFYFIFSNYAGPQEAQGIAMARMPVERRYTPVGAVEKYFQGRWREPGLGGQVTAVFPANVVWAQPDTDSFWGPSVHWNSYLEKFVMLLNHSCCSPGWPQEGVYVSFNDLLTNPKGWTTPVKILDSVPWYPQVLGFGPDGTDKSASHVARLYVGGSSAWDIEFDKATPAAPPTSPDPPAGN